MNSRKNVLDPISSMCRLIMLNFRPKETKIGLINNSINIQPPSSIQWMQRKINGDERDNISLLFFVIIRIIEWYLVPIYDLKFKNRRTKINNNLKMYFNEQKSDIDIIDIYHEIEEKDVESLWNYIYKLADYMNMGLSKLQNTYDSGNVVYSIQYYINLINLALEGKYNKNNLPKMIGFIEDKYDFEYNYIKNLWNYKKIKEICDLYDKCFETLNENFDCEENKKEKIEGYLLAVEHLLNISDNDFRQIIENHIK